MFYKIYAELIIELISKEKIERTLQPHGLAGLLTGSIKQIGHLSSSLSTSELILSKFMFFTFRIIPR